MNVKENAGYNRIKRVTEEGLIIKGTTTYSLNPEYFDVQQKKKASG
jgi:predicted transcriptional regulator